MNARHAAPWVIGALVVAGVVCLGLRLNARHDLRPTEGDSLWRLTYTVVFEAERAGAKLRMVVPGDTPQVRVFRQDVLYSELTAERSRAASSQARELSLVATRPGEYTVTARFDLHLSRRRLWSPSEPAAILSTDERARWLRSTSTIQTESQIVQDVLQDLRREQDRPGDAIQRLFEYCSTEIERGEGGESPDDGAGTLEQRTGTTLGRARALVALCRADKHPARLVTGFEIHERAELQPHTWVEVLANGRWESYDPENGFVRQMPRHFVPARRDGVNTVFVSGPAEAEAEFAMMRLPSGTGFSGSNGRHPGIILDLTRLPLSMHEVLSLILLLPLGALVTAIFRTVIGIRTFGTFSPTLIALSFVFADWRTGIAVFALVIALGLVTRSVLERLKLLMVPRLGFMLTLVVVSLVFTISLLDFLRLTPSAQAVLLPIVILTMTIERFYLTAEEDGPGFALRLLLGTVVVAFCCYLTLRWRQVGGIVFTFPEVHLFTLAAMVFLGRYTGYRLTELWRFRDLVGPHGENLSP